MITSFLLGKALPLLLAILVAPLAYLLGRFILNAWREVDDLPPGAKRVIIFAISLAIAAFFHITGQAIPVECSGLSSGNVADGCIQVIASPEFLTVALKGFLGAIGAFLLHALKKANPRD